jgi:hypothetical protein
VFAVEGPESGLILDGGGGDEGVGDFDCVALAVLAKERK